MRGKSAQEVTQEDLRKAIDSLNKLGNDFKILETGNKRVICSVSVELNDDHMALMKLAEERDGCISYSLVAKALPHYSNKDRFNRAIEKLLADGIVWEDSQG